MLEALRRLGLRFPILSERIEAASLVDVDLLVLLPALNQLVIDVHGLTSRTESQVSKQIRVKVTQAEPSENLKNLRIVATMKGTISDAKQRFRLRIVSVLAVAFKERQSCDEITLLQEVVSIW